MNLLVFVFLLVLSLGVPISKTAPWDSALNANSSTSSLSSNGGFSNFFGQILQSLNFQSSSDFFLLVKEDMIEKLNATQAAAKAEQENEDLAAHTKLLEEPDYEYVNVYNCSMMQINNATAISNAPYGCLWDASVMYAIYLGEISTANISYTLQHMDKYKTQYTAYLKAMQDSLFSDWGKWYYDNLGRNFYTCVDSNNKWNYDTIDNCEIGQSSGSWKATQFTGNPDVNIVNALITPDKISDTCASMSKYWNISFDSSDLDLVTYNTRMTASANKKWNVQYIIENTTAPKIMNMIPSPMDSISNNNVTDIDNLINFLKDQLFKSPASDLFDISSPIQAFGSASDSVTQIGIIGQNELDLEKKQREMMILNILVGVLGIFSTVLGPEMTVALDAALALASTLGSFAIEGHISPEDVILSLVGVFAGCLRGVASGLKVGEVVNKFKFAKALSSQTGLMKNFSHYTESMSELFGLVYSNIPS